MIETFFEARQAHNFAQAYQGLINDGDEIGETACIHTESEPHTYPVRVISRCRLLCKTDCNGALLYLYSEDIRWPADLFYQSFSLLIDCAKRRAHASL